VTSLMNILTRIQDSRLSRFPRLEAKRFRVVSAILIFDLIFFSFLENIRRQPILKMVVKEMVRVN
jgi:hypothetical protein